MPESALGALERDRSPRQGDWEFRERDWSICQGEESLRRGDASLRQGDASLFQKETSLLAKVTELFLKETRHFVKVTDHLLKVMRHHGEVMGHFSRKSGQNRGFSPFFSSPGLLDPDLGAVEWALRARFRTMTGLPRRATERAFHRPAGFRQAPGVRWQSEARAPTPLWGCVSKGRRRVRPPEIPSESGVALRFPPHSKVPLPLCELSLFPPRPCVSAFTSPPPGPRPRCGGKAAQFTREVATVVYR